MWIHQILRNMNRCALGQIKPELFLEAKMLKLRLSSFGHIMRRDRILWKRERLAKKFSKVESSRKRGRLNMRWTDSLKKPVGLHLQELSELLSTGPSGGLSSTESPDVRGDLMAHKNNDNAPHGVREESD